VRLTRRRLLIAALAALLPGLAPAQEQVPMPATPAVAATVNGQPIPEVAIQRVLKQQRVPPEEHATARPEILDHLIDNLLIDQYLLKHKLAVDDKEVQAKLQEIREDLKKGGQDPEKVLQGLMLTEVELKTEMAAHLRWEKFCTGQATEKALRDLLAQVPDAFDGSAVRARHILIIPADTNQATHDAAKNQLRQFRKQVEAAVAEGLAKLPSNADALAREQERIKKTEETFAAIARASSHCPSKRDGGELGTFPRLGSMVEPFAKAAFALKPFEMSDVVQTKFGYHVILVTGRKAGQPTKFEEVKEAVHEEFCNRLREQCSTALRATAKIQIAPAPK
jgi:peptidyl-prolyl cis-trans isomerase C